MKQRNRLLGPLATTVVSYMDLGKKWMSTEIVCLICELQCRSFVTAHPQREESIWTDT